jgi:hypothetical protein
LSAMPWSSSVTPCRLVTMMQRPYGTLALTYRATSNDM